MNPIDPFHHSGELLFDILIVIAEVILEVTGYDGTPEGVLGMMIMAVILLVALR